jgi:ATP adenylyltransferase
VTACGRAFYSTRPREAKPFTRGLCQELFIADGSRSDEENDVFQNLRKMRITEPLEVRQSESVASCSKTMRTSSEPAQWTGRTAEERSFLAREEAGVSRKDCISAMKRLITCLNMVNDHSFRTNFAVESYCESQHLWDTPLFESDSFVALPTVGALVEGWLLVVPRSYHLSFAELSSAMFSELDLFLKEVVAVLESTYGSVCAFEHGPVEAESAVGCGVDQAHLHLVPTQIDIRSAAQLIAPSVAWSKVDSLQALRENVAVRRNPYWFVQQRYGVSDCYIGECLYGEPPSQLFRRALATKLGCPEAFDWKIDAGEEQIAATVRRLADQTVCA